MSRLSEESGDGPGVCGTVVHDVLINLTTDTMIVPANRQVVFTTAGELFRALTTIFFALIGGQFLFLGVTLYLQSDGVVTQSSELTGILLYLVPVLGAGLVVISHMVYRAQITKGVETATLSAKLLAYYNGSLIRLAMHEGAVLFSLVSLLITGNQWFIWIAVAVMTLLITSKPSKEQAIADLRLTADESTTVRTDARLP